MVPRNIPGFISQYPDGFGPNQACTLVGSEPGSDLISGSQYISIGYGLNTADIWRRNFLVLLGFFFVFMLSQIVVIEFFPVSNHYLLSGRPWLISVH